jgi:hypothetical protein
MASPDREPAEHRDPFENLSLDEGFVRAARFIEPSAAERGRNVGDRRESARTQVVPANRRYAGGMHRLVWAPTPGVRGGRATRALAFLAIMAGVLGVVVALRHSTGRAGPGSAAGGGAQRSTASTAPTVLHGSAGGVVVGSELLASLRVGDCVNWDPDRPGGNLAAQVVACPAPHRAEVVRVVPLAWRSPGAWPGTAALDALAASECGAAFVDYVSGSRAAVDAVAGSLEPGADSWAAGTRVMACVAQARLLHPWNGSLRSTGPAAAASASASVTT